MPSVRGKKRKSQESICSTRTHNLRSHEENNLGYDSTTIISTKDKSVDTLKTVSIKEDNEVSAKHKKCKNISQEQSLEPIIDNDNAIHSLSTNVADNEVCFTASKDEESNKVKEVRTNGLTSSQENLTVVSEADCLNDNNNSIEVNNGSSSDILNSDACHTYKSASIDFYQSVEPAEPTCDKTPIVLHINCMDQVKSPEKEISAHADVMEGNDNNIANEDKQVEPTSQTCSSTFSNVEKLNLNTGIIPLQVQTNSNIDSVQCTININPIFNHELENNSKTVRGETTSRTDLDVKLPPSNGPLNACNANNHVMNGCAAQGVENKTHTLCPGDLAVESSKLLPELLIQTEIAEDTILLAQCGQENNISTLTKLNKETGDYFESNELGTTVPEGECQPCSTSDVIMRTDRKSTLGDPRNQGVGGNHVLTSTNQMSGVQLNYCEYTQAISTGGISCNKDIQDKGCTSNESSHASKSCNEDILYIDSNVTKSSSEDSKITHTLGPGLANAMSLEAAYSNQHNIVKHNEGQTSAFVEHHQSTTFHRLSRQCQNSAALYSNRNTEDINSSGSNIKDQVPSNNICNIDRIQDQICEFSTPEGSMHATQKETIESCGDKSSDLLNSQQSTQNFLESYEVEKAEADEMEIAEFEKTFASAQRWSREAVEKKKSEGTELVKVVLTQLCDMNQELMAMKRQLDIVKREMINNQLKPTTSKFFSKTNSNFSFFK